MQNSHFDLKCKLCRFSVLSTSHKRTCVVILNNNSLYNKLPMFGQIVAGNWVTGNWVFINNDERHTNQLHKTVTKIITSFRVIPT